MNILYLCDEYPPGRNGGIGTAVQLLARQMAIFGHKVIVAGFYDWGFGGEDLFIDEGVTVYRFRRKLPAHFFKNPDSLFTKATVKLLKISGILQWDIAISLKGYGLFLNELIKKHSIDIVEMPDYADYVRFVNKVIELPKLNAPVVVKMHGSRTYILRENNMHVPQNVWQIEYNRLASAAHVCSVSSYNAIATAKYLKYAGDIKVIYNGVKLQRDVRVSKQLNTVVFSGSLSFNKGVPQLMKAWNLVNNDIPEAILLVYGKGPADKMVAYLNDKAAKTVFFKGHVSRSELFTNIAAAEVAVFPSYAESFGLAPVEAMALGTATIFTRRTSGPEIIQHNENGLLVEPDDIEDIALQILYLLKNTASREQLADAGKMHVKLKFAIESIAKQHVEYYKQVVDKTK